MSVMWLSDLHIARNVWINRRTIEGDSARGLYFVERLVDAVKPAALILGADIFNVRNPPQEDIIELYRFSEALSSRGVGVWYICGSGGHDQGSEAFYTEVLKWRHLSHTLIDGMTFSGFDYSGSREAWLHNAAAAAPADYLCCHEGFRQFLGFDEAWTADGEDEEIRKFGCVLAGHVHVHSQSGKVHSSGSLTARKSDEIGKEGGCFILTRGASPVFTAIPRRRYGRARSSDTNMARDLLANPGLSGLPPVLFSVRKPEEAAFDASDYPGLIVIDVVEGETVPDTEGIAVEGDDCSLEAALDVYPLKDTDPGRYGDLRAHLPGLLNASDPKQYLTDLLKDNGIPLLEK